MALLERVDGGEGRSAPPKDMNLVPTDISAVMKDAPKDGRKPQENGIKEPTLVSFISQRWSRSCMYRRPYEQLWLSSHRNYRGLMGPDLAFTSTEKSRVFIRVTKTKVTAAVGQMLDVLYANNDFPIEIEPERLPDGVVDTESIETNPQYAPMYPNAQQNQQQGTQPGQQQAGQAPAPAPDLKYGFPGDGTRENETPNNVAAQALVGDLRQNESVQQGPALTPTAVTIDPALVSAKKMQKKMLDQLRESDADKHLRHTVFEIVNLGTGAFKGPIAVTDVETAIDEQGNITQKLGKKPRVEALSIWNLYTDPDARCVEDCDYIIQRHKLSMTQLRNLKSRPGFRSNEIDALIEGGYNYIRQWWEPMIQDMPMSQPIEKFEVMEYWGMVDKSLMYEFGLTDMDIPEELRDADELPCNIWISGHNILRFIINPLNNGRWPYYIIPYEVQPYTIWGIGVSEAMADSQMLMNGFMRLAVDNAVLAGNLIFEVDESALVPGQDFTLYPGKFFRKMGGTQGMAISPHEFPNTAQSNVQLYDKARELADEATFPSFTHGQNGVNPSIGRTSSGMSMLMGAASVGIRMAISNVNDYLLRPLGEAMFQFNIMTTDDPELKGNVRINASGVEGLMRDEVKSQRLISLIQLAENPAIAPYINMGYLIREAVRSMDLPEDKCTRTDPDAMRMMQLLAQMQPPAQPGQPQQGAPQGKQSQKQSKPNPAENQHTPAVGNPQAGQVNQPGQKGFSAAKSSGPPTHAQPGRGVS